MTKNLTLEERARERVDELGFIEAQKDFIFADWPEGDNRFQWLLTATQEEIESWGRPANGVGKKGIHERRLRRISLGRPRIKENGELRQLFGRRLVKTASRR